MEAIRINYYLFGLLSIKAKNINKKIVINPNFYSCKIQYACPGFKHATIFNIKRESSIRRRKRKARDQIGKNDEEGREGGVKEMQDIVDDLDLDLKAEEDDMKIRRGQVFESGKVTANQRRKML